MKNRRIFEPSNSYFAGRKLANKAGFFISYSKGGFAPINGGLPLPSAKKRTARESGLFDGGIVRAASFLPARKRQTVHHAHHLTTIRPPARPPGRPDKRRHRAVKFRRFKAVFSASFQPLIH